MTTERTTYKFDPPAIELGPEEFRGLISLIKKDCTSAEVSIGIESNGFKKEYSCFDDLLSDHTTPSVILNFIIRTRCDEGRCSIRYDSEGLVAIRHCSISGEEQWVKSKKNDLELFFSQKGNSIRSRSEKSRYLLIGCLIAAIPPTAFLNQYLGAELRPSTFMISFLPLWMVGLFCQNYVYPYGILKKDVDVSHRPLLRRGIEGLIGLIIVTSAAITIVDFIA